MKLLVKARSAVVLSIITFFLFTNSIFAQSTDVEFLFSAEKSPIPSGENFTLNVNLDSKSTQVNAIDLKLNYPSEKLRLISFDSEISDFEIKADEKSTPGVITIVRGTTEPKNGITKIAQVNFRTLENIDLSEISYSNDSLVIDTEGQNVLIGSQIVTTDPGDADSAEESASKMSFWDKVKAWNVSLWENIFTWISSLFSKK